MSVRRVVVLPGDGIGPEVVTAALQVLTAVTDAFGIMLQLEHCLVGAAAVHATGDPLPPETRTAVQRADAVLLVLVTPSANIGQLLYELRRNRQHIAALV